MASSKGSLGPHDRRPGNPRTQCIRFTTLGKRCKRFAVGRSKLCKSHQNQAELERDQALPPEERAGNIDPDTGLKLGATGAPPPDPSMADHVRGGIETSLVKASRKQLAAFVISQQARVALRKLGRHDPTTDPRKTLLDAVASAHQQRQVWEQMLAVVPEADWQYVGVTPVPGSQLSAKGARIEAIQRHLSDATKVAARTSKLALDAGIEERIVRLAEEQSAMIADTVRAGILAAIVSLTTELKLRPHAIKSATDAALGSAALHLKLLAAGAEQAEADQASSDESTIHEGEYKEVS